MGTVGTTTNTTPLGYPSLTTVDLDPTTGHLWAALLNSSGAIEYYTSTNNGSTWSTSGITQTTAGLVEIGSIFIDTVGYLHTTWRANSSSQDQIWYRRLNLANLTWFCPATLVSFPGNGGVAGAVHQGVDLMVVGLGAIGYCAILAVGTTSGGQNGVNIFQIEYSSGAVLVGSNNRLTGTRVWYHTSSGRVTPSIDVEHTGDGKESNTPNLWVAYGRSQMFMQRLSWNGSQWFGPSTDVTVSSAFPTAQDAVTGRWTGSAFLMAVPGVANTSKVDVYVRNSANSATTLYTTPAHPQGVVRQCTAEYTPDATSGTDFRVYAVGTSTGVLYYVDYLASTATWGSWVSSAITPLGTNQFSVRRSTIGNSHFDLLTATSGAPNTVTETPQTVAYPPNTPTWATPTSGTAQDVAAALPLTWAFSDRDPNDVQTAYAVSRQIGSGTLAYWRASDSTWQAAEVQNTSSTAALTLASGWALGTDANYTFRVKTWDSTSLASGYSAGLVVVPSVKVNPAITAPTAAQVISANTVTATWTATEQTQYRITLVTNPGGTATYDSGWVSSTTRSLTLPYTFADNTGWTLSLTTANNEGLASTAQTVNLAIDYVEPPTPTLVATPNAASGIISVALTNPAAVGSQPVLASQDVWRRPITTGQTVLNINPFFETNATDWTGVGGTAVRSTAQAHQGVASLLVTPTGGIADSYGETSRYAVTSGLYYTAGAWVRAATALKPVKIQLRWYNASNVFVSASSVQGIPAATAWQFWIVTATPPPTATQVTVAVGVTSTPAATDTASVDEAKLSVADLTAGIRVAAGVASGGTVSDWRAVSGVAYEYQAVATGTNGTTTRSPWTA